MSEPQERQQQSGTAEQGPRCIAAQDLFRGEREVQIEHRGETYRLRITKSGKLILHK